MTEAGIELPVVVRGRRQVRSPGAPRPFVHRVKVTAEQEARLRSTAGARGITVARLLVESALSGGAQAAGERAGLVAELTVLGRALGRVGVNVNQLARVSNASGEVPEAIESTLLLLRAVTARLGGVLEGLDASRRAR